MKAISSGIGGGTLNTITTGDAIKESWCDFMTLNV